MYNLKVFGPYANPPLWVMKLTVFDAAGQEAAPDGVFVRWHAESAGPDFPPVVVPVGMKMEAGHIWSEFGPLEGKNTKYTAQLVDSSGNPLSGVAVCDNGLTPIWNTLSASDEATDTTGGQVHSWFSIEARPGVVPPVPPAPDPRIAAFEAQRIVVQAKFLNVKDKYVAVASALQNLSTACGELSQEITKLMVI